MSTEYLMMVAIGVFGLMLIGIILTMIEFNKLTDDPSIRKGSGGPDVVPLEQDRANSDRRKSVG